MVGVGTGDGVRVSVGICDGVSVAVEVCEGVNVAVFSTVAVSEGDGFGVSGIGVAVSAETQLLRNKILATTQIL